MRGWSYNVLYVYRRTTNDNDDDDDDDVFVQVSSWHIATRMQEIE